jgi:hypothetical protein
MVGAFWLQIEKAILPQRYLIGIHCYTRGQNHCYTRAGTTRLEPVMHHCYTGPEPLLQPVMHHCYTGPEPLLQPVMHHCYTGPEPLLQPVMHHCYTLHHCHALSEPLGRYTH